MIEPNPPRHAASQPSHPKPKRTWWRWAAALASLSLASVSAVAALPSRVFAPYIQVDSTTSLTSISSASGIKYFTLAFIIDDGTGHGLWEAGSTVASDSSIAPAIANLRAAGGDVIISFGGASGNELAIGVTSASTLQSVYQGIINKYGVTALDFDIEGSALDNTSANDRRNQALAGLQAANPGLFISYTLPVNPTGLDPNSIALLQNAKSHGVNVACVNIMAMDYGSSTSPSMGQDAIDATNATSSQLSSNGLTTQIGITPLIGNQDTAPEVFTISDAQTVENFAVGNSQVSRLTFWEVALDQCGSSCTGVSQTPWQFSHIFEPFTSSGSGGGTSSNVAPLGTAYGWSANTSSTANTNRAAQPGLNDNNLTNNVDLDSAGDAISAWEGAGVVWSSAQTITSAKFINGDITTGGDGFLTANCTLQYSTDGSTWINTGWTITPTYPNSSSAGGQTYSASGTALSGVLGMRFVGQVRTTDTSYHWIVKEVQFIGSGSTTTNYTISASAGTGGTISPSGSVSVTQGANQTFSIAASSGYAISSVTVDGTNVGAVSSYTFSNVQANHTISAAFSAVTTAYTITASAGMGGSISPTGTVTVNQGTSQTFTIAANSGYTISSVTVDGASVGAVSTYTFSNVQANHTISAAFSASSNGVTITSATGFYNQALSAAQTGTFTATWDASASLSPSNSLVGLSQGSATAYTGIAVAIRFNPSGDIDARNGGAYAAASTIPFSANTTYHFRVVVDVVAHTYSAYVTAPGGSETTIGTNYAFRTEQAGVTQLDTWNGDVNATPGGSMTVSNFTAPVAGTTYTITASAGTGGSISPSGSVSVAQGGSQTFTIAASSGYAISSVTVDGANVGAVSSYTFSNVQANHTISAAFSAMSSTFTITASAGTGGTISPSGSVSVTQGASQTFTIAASSGYTISGVTVDGTGVGAVSSYTFSNVQANHTISAAFSAVTNSNIAPSGTAYGWNANTSSTANTNRSAQAGLNDNNLTNNVDLDSAGDAIGAWEGAGVVWSSAVNITSAKFINGDITSGGDGYLTANCTLQYSTDGSTWTNTGWTISPTYPNSSSAGGQTYSASGTALSGVRGMRFVGQVRTTDTSYHWIVKEVQFIGNTGSSGGTTVATPTFSPAGGSYSSAQSVSITTTTSGASIRYTTDGSTPSETAGTLYAGPINVSATTTLKAIAYESGMTDSGVASATYTIGSGTTNYTPAQILSGVQARMTSTNQVNTKPHINTMTRAMNVNVYQVSTGVFAYTSSMAIDTDGSDPDPDPDHQSTTTWTDDNGAYLGAHHVPYYVLGDDCYDKTSPCPHFYYVEHNITGLQFALIFYNGKCIGAVFGDTQGTDTTSTSSNDSRELGEASVESANLLGIPSSGTTGGVNDGVTVVIFSGSQWVVKGTNTTLQANAQALVQKALNQLGNAWGM